MVNRAVQGRYNAIFPEILGYHDNAAGAHGAYWNSSIVPKAPDIEAGLDPLAYLCQQAHAQGIQVHVWLVPFRASIAWPPAGNTTLSNHSEYVMVPRANSGGGVAGIGSPAAYYLDPGSPDAQEYILSIVRELVTNYPIDGVHYDYIRYVQADAGYPSSSTYAQSGLKRFQRITGRSDTPAATGDSAWDDFRRRGITELVRRTRAEIPGMISSRQPVRLSTAVVTWGNAPSDLPGQRRLRPVLQLGGMAEARFHRHLLPHDLLRRVVLSDLVSQLGRQGDALALQPPHGRRARPST